MVERIGLRVESRPLTHPPTSTSPVRCWMFSVECSMFVFAILHPLSASFALITSTHPPTSLLPFTFELLRIAPMTTVATNQRTLPGSANVNQT
jgi:hypothetical protein